MASEELYWRAIVSAEANEFLVDAWESLQEAKGLSHRDECDACDAYLGGIEAAVTFIAMGIVEARVDSKLMRAASQSTVSEIEDYLSKLHDLDPQEDIEGKPE